MTDVTEGAEKTSLVAPILPSPKKPILDEKLDGIIKGWSDGTPTSEHLLLAAEYAFLSGYKVGDPMPLLPGEAVPACGCPDCTGIPWDHPARAPTATRPLRSRGRAWYRRRGGGRPVGVPRCNR